MAIALGIPNHTRILFVSDDERPTREFEISRAMIVSLAVLGLILVGFVSAVLVGYALQIREVRNFDSLQAEVGRANERLATVAGLTRELEEMRSFQERLLTILGVDAFDGSAGAISDSLAPWSMTEGATITENLRRTASVVMSPAPDLWPTPGYVTREFIAGDVSRGIRPHLGIDIAGPTNAALLAAANGRVVRSGTDDYLGNFVEIQHGLGYVTVYGHCSRIAVQKGDRIERGQVVAYLGQSGQASAPHVHFEIWREGEAINPRKLLAGEPPRQ